MVVDKYFYNENYYYGDDGQYVNLAKKNGYNDDMILRAATLLKIFNPKSVLELGAGTGQLIEINISEFATKDKGYMICGDASEVDYPEADVVCSFDLLEHLTIEQIDKVLEKCKNFPSIFLSISVAYEDYGDVTLLPNMDKSHISMLPHEWWVKKIFGVYCNSHYITMMTRKDYVYEDYGKYKFTNVNFMMTDDVLNKLQII